MSNKTIQELTRQLQEQEQIVAALEEEKRVFQAYLKHLKDELLEDKLLTGSQRNISKKPVKKAQKKENPLDLLDLLKQVKAKILILKDELAKLTAPPLMYATFVNANPDGTVNIKIGDGEWKTNVYQGIDYTKLKPGQQVILNKDMHVVEVAGFKTKGRVVTFKEQLNKTHIIVTNDFGVEEVAETAGSLIGVNLKKGDFLCYDPSSGYVYKRLPKKKTEDFLLEDNTHDITYKDIGGLTTQIETIREEVEYPIVYENIFKKHGVTTPKGIFLYGPPGCGKTYLAKAVANEIAHSLTQKLGKQVKGHFLNIKGPELLTKWTGGTEWQIRRIFQRARQKAKEGHIVVIFFDEMDSIFCARNSDTSSDMKSTMVMVPTLLTELDGIKELTNVIVIGASNRQDLIDPAVLRPGRFDIKLKIPYADTPETAADVLSKHLTPFDIISEKYLVNTYTPKDRHGVPRKDQKGKIIQYHFGKNPAKVISEYFIPLTVRRIFDVNHPLNKLFEVFLETAPGKIEKQFLYFSHFFSGSVAQSIVMRARKAVVRRKIKYLRQEITPEEYIKLYECKPDTDGIQLQDLFQAIEGEIIENKNLPNTIDEVENHLHVILGPEAQNVRAIRSLSVEQKVIEKDKEEAIGNYL